jgi:hypothetical protein
MSYFSFRYHHLSITPKKRLKMNLSEKLMAESLDDMIRRSTLRLEQEAASVSNLRKGGDPAISAGAHLSRSTAALDKLKVYRAKFH